MQIGVLRPKVAAHLNQLKTCYPVQLHVLYEHFSHTISIKIHNGPLALPLAPDPDPDSINMD